MDTLERADGNEELWYTVFADGHPLLAKKQGRFTLLPSDPRCKLCYAPFGGMGGWFMRLRGLKPSARNPRYCTACDSFLEAFPGGAEVTMSMLIMDIRDSVPMSAELSPKDFAATVNAVRDAVTDTLCEHDGFVLEFQGDSIFAVWPPGFSGDDHAKKAIAAAESAVRTLVRKAGSDQTVPIGMAVHTGEVYIGTVTAAGGRMQGISAFGYDVNLVARLAAQAAPGEALISKAACDAAQRPAEPDQTVSKDLKGVEGPTEAVVLTA